MESSCPLLTGDTLERLGIVRLNVEDSKNAICNDFESGEESKVKSNVGIQRPGSAQMISCRSQPVGFGYARSLLGCGFDSSLYSLA